MKITLIAIILLLSACTVNTDNESSEIKDVIITTQDIENAEQSKNKARIIAQYITQESDGLVYVTYSDIPSHGVSQETGKEFFGLHYSMMPLRHSYEVTSEDMEKTQELAGHIFKLSTQYILKENPAITHMGVQIINPSAWFWSGEDAHLYIATSDNLTHVPEDASLSGWFAVSSDTPILLITESQLQNLLEQLQEK